MYKFSITYKAYDLNGKLLGNGTSNVNAHTLEGAKKFLDEHLKTKISDYSYFLSDFHSHEPINADTTFINKESENIFNNIMGALKIKKKR